MNSIGHVPASNSQPSPHTPKSPDSVAALEWHGQSASKGTKRKVEAFNDPIEPELVEIAMNYATEEIEEISPFRPVCPTTYEFASEAPLLKRPKPSNFIKGSREESGRVSALTLGTLSLGSPSPSPATAK